MILGLPITYFLIAPKDAFGLNVGSTGLAIKMVSIQFLAVNTQLYFNSKLLKLSFKKYLLHQILSISILFLVAFFVSKMLDYLIFIENTIITFLINGIVYTLSVCCITYLIPDLFGLKKADIQMILKRIRRGT